MTHGWLIRAHGWARRLLLLLGVLLAANGIPIAPPPAFDLQAGIDREGGNAAVLEKRPSFGVAATVKKPDGPAGRQVHPDNATAPTLLALPTDRAVYEPIFTSVLRHATGVFPKPASTGPPLA